MKILPLVKTRGMIFYKRGAMQTIFTLNKLSMNFYESYPANVYTEIEYKPERPYIVMVIEIDGNRFALPFRTNIRHNYCYKFRNSGRETQSSTGIDFTKAVIVNDDSYIGEHTTIDNKEYVELMNKFYFIVSKFKQYLNGYKEYRKFGGDEILTRKYRFTTLKYFERELKI